MDGATGTNLQKAGMPTGVCVEQWALDNTNTLLDLQRAYFESGADAVVTCTFGGTKPKLSHYGLDDKAADLNTALAQVSKAAAFFNNGMVGGDIGSCGLMAAPFGDTELSDIVECFYEQAKSLAAFCDFFAIETMTSVWEARAAILGCKKADPDMPIYVTMTFDNGRALSGASPLSALISLQDMGISAFGINCSTGPSEVADLISSIAAYAHIPLAAKPNAGTPSFKEDGSAVFEMSDKEFASYIPNLCDAGAVIFGGCCGTSPSTIKAINSMLENIDSSVVVEKVTEQFISNEKTVCKITQAFASSLPSAIECSDFLSDDIMDACDSDGEMIHVAIKNNSDAELLLENLYLVGKPLVITCDDPELIDMIAFNYAGRLAVISSAASARKESLSGLYGILFI